MWATWYDLIQKELPGTEKQILSIMRNLTNLLKRSFIKLHLINISLIKNFATYEQPDQPKGL